ncbi:MAG: hypothetical protein ABSG90_00595 [Dehalococcoidia bacterium]|jgi:hypothetical protein
MAGDASGLKAEDLEKLIQKKETDVIGRFSGSKAVFDDCSSLISKARGYIKDNNLLEANDALFKLEARIKSADESGAIFKKWRYRYGLILLHLFFAFLALGIGWIAICGPYLPCRSCDNSTQSVGVNTTTQNSEQVSAQGSEQNTSKNPMEQTNVLTLVNWLVLGFASGMLGGAMIGIFGLIYHGIQRDFSEDYLDWYWSKPLKGAFSGLIAVLPFMAGLAVFKITSAVEIQTTIAYISVISFLVGFNERNFLQLLNTVGKSVFGPGDTNGGTDSTTTKPG